MESDEGVVAAGAIASLISSLAATGAAAYQASQSGKGGTAGPIGPTKADLASSGATKPEPGGATPGFKAGLSGAPTGPLKGAEAITDKPIGGSADEFAGALQKASPVGGGLTGVDLTGITGSMG